MDHLPDEINGYKLRVCYTDEIFQIEYSKSQSFLIGRRDTEEFDPDDILIEAFTILDRKSKNHEEAERKTREDLLMLLNVSNFISWEFKGAITEWDTPVLIMELGKKKVFIKVIKVALVLNFRDGIYHIVCVLPDLRRDLNIIFDNIQALKELIHSQNINFAESEFELFDMTFSRKIFVYTNEVNVDKKEVLKRFKLRKGINLSIRDKYYRNNKMKKAKPDFFICHDWNDKKMVAKPIYEELTSRGYYVWLDETELLIGDSIQKKISKGIQNCTFGILILSKNLIKNKRWADFEAQSLMNRHITNNQNIILPIWHNVDEVDISKYSPYLIDKYALKTEDGISSIVDGLEAKFKSYPIP